MAVYVITGKLGAGKTLCAVGKIQEYLYRNLPVATNLNIKTNFIVNESSKKMRLTRLSDRPTAEELEALGYGNKSTDESKNGLLVFDECATWFNSRKWNDAGRQELINWLLHARKYGWDIIFIIQDISVMDNQARELFAEHVVYCRRMDKMRIPVFGRLIYWLTFSAIDLHMPKVHIANVRYGSALSSVLVDTWYYMGHSLYDCYDTKQIFSANNNNPFCYIPPYYTHCIKRKNLNWRDYMRLTRIYWKKVSKLRIVLTTFAFTCAAFFLHDYFHDFHFTKLSLFPKDDKTISEKKQPQGQLKGLDITQPITNPSVEPLIESTNNSATDSLSTLLGDYYVAVMAKKKEKTLLLLKSLSGNQPTLSLFELQRMGIFVSFDNDHHVIFTRGVDQYTIKF